jgi:preprotein translocase subunit SecG
METVVTVVHIITCVLLVLIVLMQSGKGAEISASLGGSSNTIFGSSGGANVFVRITQALAAVFFITSLGLTYLGNGGKKSVFDGASVPAAPASQTAPNGQTAPTGGQPASKP